MTVQLKTNIPSPIVRKASTETTQLGITRRDDYGWMKDENWQAMMADTSTLDPAIRSHLETENEYSQAVMSDLSGLKDSIFEEMKGRLKPDASGVPSPDGGFAYNHRYRIGDQHVRDFCKADERRPS